MIKSRSISLEYIKEKYQYFLLIIPFTIPLTAPVVNNRIIAFSMIGIFLLSLAEGTWKNFRLNKYHALLIGFYILQVFGLTYTQNLKEGLRDLETMLPLLAFPLFFGLMKNYVTDDKINLYLYSFAAGVLVTCLLSSVLLFSEWDGRDFFGYLSQNGHVKFSRLVHPTYLGIYTAFSILFLIDEFLMRHGHKKIRLIAIVVLCGFLIIINAKMSLLAFVFSAILYSFVRLKTLKRRMTLLSLLGLFLLLLLLYTPTRVRFIDAPLKVLKMRGNVDAFDQPTWSYSFRLQIYTCALDKIADSPLIGYGTGSSKDVLIDCYEEKEYPWMLSRKFNAHNEYFEECLKHGLIGLIMLLVLLVTPLKNALSEKQYLVGAFFILIMISALTENLLSVQKGVNFIAFFYTILAMRLSNGSKKQRISGS